MAKENIFEKEWVDERDKNNLEGVLEQLNLPPAVVRFVKEHKRVVQIGVALVVIAIVAWSFYSSYRQNRIQSASSSLSAALQLEGQERISALQGVETDFSGTAASRWAELEIGHQLLRDGKAEEAKAQYRNVRSSLKASSPLQPLVTVALAEAAEALGQYSEAIAEYQALTEVEGFAGLGYSGVARMYEVQGDTAQALNTYETYLGTLISSNRSAQQALVEEKIARLKAAM